MNRKNFGMPQVLIQCDSLLTVSSKTVRQASTLNVNVFIIYCNLRFVMIKYAHRGLVKSGELPSLFYLLYLLISVVFYSQWLLLAVFSFLFSPSKILEENVLKTFKGDDDLVKDISVYSYWRYFASSMCIFLILFFIMSLGIFYLKRKSKKNCHFRQNVFTFESTLFWGLIHFGLFLSFHLTITSGEIDSIQISVLRFFMIFSHFIKSVVTIFENQKCFPELFSDTEISCLSCNFNFTNISPRHETLMPFIPFQQNAR